MNINEYQLAASRTMDQTRSFSKELITFGLGISGEAGEIADLVDRKILDNTLYNKELGDVLWYTAGLTTLLERKFSDLYGTNKWDGIEGVTAYYQSKMLHTGGVYVLRLCAKAGAISDYIKKVEGHGHMLDYQKLLDLLKAIAHPIIDIAIWRDLKMSDICEANIDKLKKRYPQGFTETASKNRVE